MDRTLGDSHRQVFSQWLGLNLAEQMSDLNEHLNRAAGPRQAMHYRNLVPVSASEAEVQLYLTDLETLLELRKFEGGAACATPGA